MPNFLHHLFIPRESNNHRAKLLHHDSLLIVILLLLIGIVSLTSIQKNFPQVLGISSNIRPEDLLTLTNHERQQHGLPPLHIDSELAQAASQKAADMFTKNYWAHIAPDGITPWVFIKNSGYEYLYAGENLARGFNTSSDVVNAWMASPSHRENVLSPNYNDVGFAVASGSLTGSDTILVVEEFGSRYLAKSPAQTDTAAEKIAITYPALTPPLLAQNLTPIPSPSSQPVEILPIQSPNNQTPLPTDQTQVAAITSQPLVNSQNIYQRIAIGIILLFMATLIIDAIIIERKKIVRVVAHNLDHIIYLSIMILLIIMLKNGIIL